MFSLYFKDNFYNKKILSDTLNVKNCDKILKIELNKLVNKDITLDLDKFDSITEINFNEC